MLFTIVSLFSFVCYTTDQLGRVYWSGIRMSASCCTRKQALGVSECLGGDGTRIPDFYIFFSLPKAAGNHDAVSLQGKKLARLIWERVRAYATI